MKNFVRPFFLMFTSLGVLIPLLVGIPFLWLGMKEYFNTQQMVRISVETEGVVVDNDYVTNSEGGTYVPVVSFTTARGETVRFSDGIGDYPAAFEEGETVSVLYDPGNVRDAHINTWIRLWGLAALFTVIGLIPVGIGLGIGFFSAGGLLLLRRSRR